MSSDDQQNLPAVPQPAQLVHALEMPIAEFEGEMVRIMVGKMPSINLEMDYGYRRGTHLKLEFEVEVIRIGIDEVKATSKITGHQKGDLIRDHTFAIREAKIVGAYTAEQMDQGVGGGLAATGADIEDAETDSDDSPESDPERTEHDQFDPGF